MKSKLILMTTLATVGGGMLMTTQAEAEESLDQKDNGNPYLIEKGDSLSKIAKKFDVEVDTLKEVNDLESDLILAGKELYLAEGIQYLITHDVEVEVDKYHKMELSDTLESIAETYGITVDELKEKNGIENIFLLDKTELLVGTETKVVNEEKLLFLGAEVDILEELEKFTNAELKEANVVKLGMEQGVKVIEELDVELILNPPEPEVEATPSTISLEELKKSADLKGTTIGDRAIEFGMTMLGTPYVFGGTSMTGIDCSGFIYITFNKAGMNIPRTTALGYYNMAEKVTEPQVGDLVFFSDTYKPGISHIGIYIGGGKMLDASGTQVGVRDITSGYWANHFTSFGRIAN